MEGIGETRCSFFASHPADHGLWRSSETVTMAMMAAGRMLY
jgi:hypothetical protein